MNDRTLDEQKPAHKHLTVYVAASFKHMHAVQLLQSAIRRICPMVTILDWTAKACPPPSMTPAQRREWFDAEQDGGQVFKFCHNACIDADMVIYLGESGQDAGVEIGIAAGNGVPTIGLRGPLEAPGLMLNGAVQEWATSVDDLLGRVRKHIEAKMEIEQFSCGECQMWGCDRAVKA